MKLIQGSVTEGGIAKLMGSERAALVYSDPPWGLGNLRYWRTMANRAEGAGVIPVDPQWDGFLKAYCEG